MASTNNSGWSVSIVRRDMEFSAIKCESPQTETGTVGSDLQSVKHYLIYSICSLSIAFKIICQSKQLRIWLLEKFFYANFTALFNISHCSLHEMISSYVSGAAFFEENSLQRCGQQRLFGRIVCGIHRRWWWWYDSHLHIENSTSEKPCPPTFTVFKHQASVMQTQCPPPLFLPESYDLSSTTTWPGMLWWRQVSVKAWTLNLGWPGCSGWAGKGAMTSDCLKKSAAVYPNLRLLFQCKCLYFSQE